MKLIVASVFISYLCISKSGILIEEKKKKKVPASSIWTRNLTEPIAEYNSDLTLVWQIKNVSYSASVQTSHIPSLSYFWLPKYDHLRVPKSASLLTIYHLWNEVSPTWKKLIPDITQQNCFMARFISMCQYWGHCSSPCTLHLPTVFFSSNFMASIIEQDWLRSPD